MSFEIKKEEARFVACVRHVGPYPEIGPKFAKICGWAAKRQVFGPKTEVIGVFWDDPKCVPAEELRSAAAVSIARDFELSAESDADIETLEIPAGHYIFHIHNGPYETLHESYLKIKTWMAEKNMQFCDGQPCFERYMNSPDQVKPEELITEIYVSVQQ